MHTPASAARLILEHLAPLEVETVPLDDATDRVLAADVTSPLDLPPWPNSAMDGYAAIASDFAGTPPLELDVVEEIAAGTFPTVTLTPGHCSRIFTGAPVPDGADTVIRQEDTEPLDRARVRVTSFRDRGANVRAQGEDLRRGTVAVAAGTALSPAAVGHLAAVAAFDVPVYRRPRVAILASGDELADRDERDAIAAGRKIASSNTYTLRALVRQCGAIPIDLGLAADDPADLRQRLERAVDADLIVTTAGISVGEHDYLHEVLASLDVEQKFWRLRMRPGAPVAFGTVGALGGAPWIGLPGNPVSTMVTFELFVRPAIRRLSGHPQPYRRTTAVTCAESVTLRAPLRHFLRVTLTADAPVPVARLTGPQGSGLLHSMVRADALMIVPEDCGTAPAGAGFDAIVLDDPHYVEACPW